MAQTGGTRAVRAITPVRPNAPSPSSTDSNRATTNPCPNAARHNDTSQKYSGGCTSVTRKSRAIAPRLASPDCSTRARPAGNTTTGHAGRGTPDVRNSVYCSSYSAPRSHAARHSTTAHGNKAHRIGR